MELADLQRNVDDQIQFFGTFYVLYVFRVGLKCHHFVLY